MQSFNAMSQTQFIPNSDSLSLPFFRRCQIRLSTLSPDNKYAQVDAGRNWRRRGDDGKKSASHRNIWPTQTKSERKIDDNIRMINDMAALLLSSSSNSVMIDSDEPRKTFTHNEVEVTRYLRSPGRRLGSQITGKLRPESDTIERESKQITHLPLELDPALPAGQTAMQNGSGEMISEKLSSTVSPRNLISLDGPNLIGSLLSANETSKAEDKIKKNAEDLHVARQLESANDKVSSEQQQTRTPMGKNESTGSELLAETTELSSLIKFESSMKGEEVSTMESSSLSSLPLRSLLSKNLDSEYESDVVAVASEANASSGLHRMEADLSSNAFTAKSSLGDLIEKSLSSSTQMSASPSSSSSSQMARIIGKRRIDNVVVDDDQDGKKSNETNPLNANANANLQTTDTNASVQQISGGDDKANLSSTSPQSSTMKQVTSYIAVATQSPERDPNSSNSNSNGNNANELEVAVNVGGGGGGGSVGVVDDDEDYYFDEEADVDQDEPSSRKQWTPVPSEDLRHKMCRFGKDTYLEFETFSLQSCSTCFK